MHIRKKYYLLSIALLLALSVAALAQAPDTVWSAKFNGIADYNDHGRACAVDPAGYLYMTGFTSTNSYGDMVVTVKCDPVTGDTIWLSKESAYSSQSNACAIDALGHLYVAGYVGDYAIRKLYVIKYNIYTGDTVWTRQYLPNSGDYYEAYGCAADSFGNVYITGTSDGGGCTTMKINGSTGDTLWTTTDCLSYAVYKGRACAVNDSGFVYVVGSSYNIASEDYTIIKYNGSNGDLVWIRTFDSGFNGEDTAFACCMDNNGGLYVTGCSSNGSNIDYLTVKYNAVTGDTIWSKRYNSPLDSNDGARACAIDESGYLYVTGQSYNGQSYDYLTAKYDANSGDTCWTRRFKGGGGIDYFKDCPYGCAADKMGNIYIIGTYWHNESDLIAIKYDAVTGDSLWYKRHSCPNYAEDYAYGCAVDNAGQLYVTGSCGNGFSDDVMTIKYDPATGGSIFTARYNSPNNSVDYGYDCIIDNSGHLYVTGSSLSDTYSYDFLTIKYNSVTSETLWTAKCQNLGNDHAYDLALDSSGGLYIVGSSSNGSNNDYLTIKYNAETGDTIWLARYNGPDNREDHAKACSYDDDGYLYVTGGCNGYQDYDYLTIKYDAITKDTIWTAQYQSQPLKDDIANDCGLDSDGNLYVTGYSISSEYDILTIKYDGATGDTVWSARYSGPFGTQDEGKSCLIGKDGYLYVTGNTIDSISDKMGYIIIKYNIATGETLWTKCHFPANGYRANGGGGVIDDMGNIYVTGYIWEISGSGTYDFYTVKFNTVTGIWEEPTQKEAINAFNLYTNSPNPFSQSTTIRYQTPTTNNMSLNIYNIAGQLVRILDNGYRISGVYEAKWDGRDQSNRKVSNGVYFYKLVAGDKQAIKKMIVIR